MTVQATIFEKFAQVARDQDKQLAPLSDDLVLLETDKHNLLCVRRADGVQKWTCELSDAIRYSP